MVQVRAATRDDAEAFLALVDELAGFEKLAGPTGAARERLVEAAFGDRRRLEVFVAEVDGRAVAYAACFETYSTFRARPTLFLEDLYVTPAARRGGVATAMLEYLRALAVERGCGRFEWTVLDWNEKAQALYERFGARRLEQWYVYRLDL